MTFAQIIYRQSLRDIETCLRAMQSKLYHCGIRGRVSRNTLAKANENRDWRIYAGFARILINIARRLYAEEDFGVELQQASYALDLTTIDLCLSLFPWVKFRKHKAAVKLRFIRITDGKVHDVNILDELVLESGSFYIMDRGYIDFLLANADYTAMGWPTGYGSATLQGTTEEKPDQLTMHMEEAVDQTGVPAGYTTYEFYATLGTDLGIF